MKARVTSAGKKAREKKMIEDEAKRQKEIEAESKKIQTFIQGMIDYSDDETPTPAKKAINQ